MMMMMMMIGEVVLHRSRAREGLPMNDIGSFERHLEPIEPDRVARDRQQRDAEIHDRQVSYQGPSIHADQAPRTPPQLVPMPADVSER